MGTKLKQGDIIRLERGMKVSADIPNRLYFHNRPFSDGNYHAVFEIGKVYRKTIPEKQTLVDTLLPVIDNTLLGLAPQYTESMGRKLLAFVDSLNLDFTPEEFDTAQFAGEYKVYQVAKGLVWAEKTDGSGLKVDFPLV